LISAWIGAYSVAKDITTSTDGYEFLTKEFSQFNIDLYVVYYGSFDELQLEG